MLFLTTVFFAGLQDKPAQKEEGVRGKVNLSALVTVVDFHLALAVSERCSGPGREIFLPRNEA